MNTRTPEVLTPASQLMMALTSTRTTAASDELSPCQLKKQKARNDLIERLHVTSPLRFDPETQTHVATNRAARRAHRREYIRAVREDAKRAHPKTTDGANLRASRQRNALAEADEILTARIDRAHDLIERHSDGDFDCDVDCHVDSVVRNHNMCLDVRRAAAIGAAA